MLIDRVNTAVLVSGNGTNLQALIDAERGLEMKNVRLRLVVSNNPSAYALERAKQAGIPAVFIENDDRFEERLLAELNKYGIELIILAGFMRILSADFVARNRTRIINVHPSLLPAFCGKGFYGLKVHEAALERGVKITGATVHIVTAEADAGPILLQKAVHVLKNDTPDRLQKRVMREAEWVLLPKAANMMAEMIRKFGTEHPSPSER